MNRPSNPETPIARFLTSLLDRHKLKNDAALSRFVGIAPPVISKLRNGLVELTPGHIIRFHEATDLSVKEIKAATAS